jgi:hypothetical protein
MQAGLDQVCEILFEDRAALARQLLLHLDPEHEGAVTRERFLARFGSGMGQVRARASAWRQ